MPLIAQPPPRQLYDVLVIGGGPAGTTTAALLASKGYTVVLVEKDRHPRFHIGESLLPRNMPVLRRLGVLDEVTEIGVVKRGADFSDAHDNTYVIFDFSNALAPDEPTALQVKREEFDHILINNAATKGVTVMQSARITDVQFVSASIEATVEGEDGNEIQLHARFAVDASGRDAFLSTRLGLKRRNPKHNSVAVFGHFSGVPRRHGDESGNISVYWFPHGWFWLIPLNDGRMSIGMVCWPKFMKTRQGTLEQFFWDGVALAPHMQVRMQDAKPLGEIIATGNFSYTSTQMTGDRFLLVGDAYAFIDPVFSSGVYLAMQGAEFAAEAVDGYLREPHKAAKHMKKYERRVSRGLEQFSWFIYRFTSPAMRYLFTHPTNYLGIRAAVTSVLSGDIFGRTVLWPRLMAFRTLYYVFSLVFWRAGKAYRDRF
ncbi:MAG: NAD(P)/FAD-dependent oxidoreductase [Rhodospirillales bacterium]